MVLSDTIATSATQDEVLYHTFSFRQEKSERKVLDAFIKGDAKVALLRADMLRKLYKNNENRLAPNYTIIGKTLKKSRLYYAGKLKGHDLLNLKHTKLSVGILENAANVYLKALLKENNISYSLNTVSIDAYRSIRHIRTQNIDGIFLFASQSYKNIIANYIKPYPEVMMKFLKKQHDFECNNTYCFLPYYLVARKSLSEHVMQNIYMQTKSILDIESPLVAGLGEYLIGITPPSKPLQPFIAKKLKKKEVKIPQVRTNDNPKLHRAPWMDLALGEAIRGKGSTEYQLPMLDQSYKYIRFAKGDKGITTAPNDSKFGSWCAAYICWTLGNSGFTIHKDGRMASQAFRYNKKILYRKIDKPIFGAIVLYTKVTNPAHGHIGYLFGLTPSKKYILLGGNQNNRLKFAAYPKRFGSYKLNGFYVPINYQITSKDRLRKKDYYPSAKFLNKKYGIIHKSNNHKVR
jgi:uncharacterized protein (TIGR02594 family)